MSEQGTTCQECGRNCVRVPGIEIYPRVKETHDKWYWQCMGCAAYVGCHGTSSVPLGTAAGPKLRQARMQAHRFFDYLWLAKMKATGCSKREARRAGYEWLAKQLGIEFDKCHIAQIGYDQCKQVVKVCTPYFRKALGILESKGIDDARVQLAEEQSQAPAQQPEAWSDEGTHGKEDFQVVLPPEKPEVAVQHATSVQDDTASGRSFSDRSVKYWTSHIVDNLHAVIVFLNAPRIPCHYCEVPYLRNDLGITYDPHAPESILACSRCMPKQLCHSRGVGRGDAGNAGTMRQLIRYKQDHADLS